MDKISSLVNLESFRQQKEQTEVNREKTADVVNMLFKELSYIYPSVKNMMNNAQDFMMLKRTWTKAFLLAKLDNINQLRYGIQRARLSGEDFLPNAGKFISWCRPEAKDLGVKDCEEAYREACFNAHPCTTIREWSHDLIRHTAIEAGLHNLITLSRDKSYPLFARSYGIALNMLIDGKPFSSIPKAITQEPEPKKEDLPKMTANEAFVAMRKSLGMSDKKM